MENAQENPEEEKRKRLISATGSVLFMAALLVWFSLHSCWSPPDPPHPSYGIELNFGMDASGFGDQQTKSPANNSESQSESEPAPGEPEESAESEAAQASSEQAVETESESETALPSEAESSEPATENNQSQSEESSRQAPNYNQQSGARNASGESESAPANNNGDQPGEVGDQGDPQGSVDSKALYGQQGSGGDGASLDMTGWKWDRVPRPNDETDEEGRIVFKIKVDDMGEIVRVQTVESTVSPSTVKIYENEVRRLTFSKTRDNVRPAPFSEGKITFIIKAD